MMDRSRMVPLEQELWDKVFLIVVQAQVDFLKADAIHWGIFDKFSPSGETIRLASEYADKAVEARTRGRGIPT